MNKKVTHVKNVLGGTIIIGFLIQSILGLCYFVLSFSTFQEFGDSYLYLEASKNLLCDQYTGILYPFFLLCVNGIAGMIHVPFYILVKILQVLVAFLCGFFFVKSIKKIHWAICMVASFSIMTMPALMQCHTAVLPHSFTFSFLLFELGWFIRFIKYKDEKNISGFMICICYAVETLLMPEYLLFGLLPVAVSVIVTAAKWKKDRSIRNIFGILFSLFIFGVLLYSVGMLQQSEKTGRAAKSFEAMAMGRFAGNCLSETYGYWPEELKACIDEQTVIQCDNLVLDRQFVLVEKAVAQLGEKKAKKAFLQVAKAGYNIYYRQVRHDLVMDLVAYTISPFFLQYQLQGRGPMSFSGRNYDIMRSACPRVTALYVDFGGWWFFAGHLMAAFLLCICFVENLVKKKKVISARKAACFSTIIVMGVSMIFWYTMQGAGMMDYKNTIFVLAAFWMMDFAALAKMSFMSVKNNLEDGKI